MKNYLQLRGVVVLLWALALFSSCEDEEPVYPQKPLLESQIGSELSFAIQTFSDLKWILDQAESGNLESYKNGASQNSSCAKITRDSAQKKIIVDFGSTNCIGDDNRSRRGKLEASVLGDYWSNSSVVTIRFINFFVDDFEVRGSCIISAQGIDKRGNLSWKMDIEGMLVHPNRTDSSEWLADCQFHWIDGDQTPKQWSDDDWDITGFGDFISKEGKGWRIEIDKPLHRSMTCPYFDKGLIFLNRPGLMAHVLRYGDGSCDDDADIRIKDEIIHFSLK